MIQRTILRQSRIIGPKVSHFPCTSLPRFCGSSLTPPPRPALWRCYSSELDSIKSEDEPNSITAMKTDKNSEQSDLTKELESKNKEIIELKDMYLRSVAEFRNLQERTKRDMQTARDFAIQKFAKDLVDSVDNLDRAIAMVPEEKLEAAEKKEHLQDLVSLYEGLKMTEKILMATLKKHGLERFDPSVDGEKFNPNEHEATFMTPVEGKDDNTVFLTQQKGFKLNGRVLRAAKVGVVKNS